MKYILMLFFVFSEFAMSSVVPIDKEIVQPKTCGLEQRDSKGRLLPILLEDPIKLNCADCDISFTFDVPSSGGYPKNVEVKYKGLSAEDAQRYINTFTGSWAFPYCINNGKKSGFYWEVWRFEGGASQSWVVCSGPSVLHRMPTLDTFCNDWGQQ